MDHASGARRPMRPCVIGVRPQLGSDPYRALHNPGHHCAFAGMTGVGPMSPHRTGNVPAHHRRETSGQGRCPRPPTGLTKFWAAIADYLTLAVPGPLPRMTGPCNCSTPTARGRAESCRLQSIDWQGCVRGGSSDPPPFFADRPETRSKALVRDDIAASS